MQLVSYSASSHITNLKRTGPQSSASYYKCQNRRSTMLMSARQIGQPLRTAKTFQMTDARFAKSVIMLRLTTHTNCVPVFSSPAFSTPANLVPRFPVPRFQSPRCPRNYHHVLFIFFLKSKIIAVNRLVLYGQSQHYYG